VDARRRSSAIGTAPQVMYTTRDPPLEVRNAPGIAGVKRSEDVGWITFGMYRSKLLAAIWLIQCFARLSLIPSAFRDP
jgi:hypothetical protein